MGETLTPALMFRSYFCPRPLPHVMFHPPSSWLGDTRIVTKHAGSQPLLWACHSHVFSFFVLTIVPLLESSLTLSHPKEIDQSLLPLQRPINAESPPGNSPGDHRTSSPRPHTSCHGTASQSHLNRPQDLLSILSSRQI